MRRLAGAGHEVAVFHRGRTGSDLPEGVGHFLGDRQGLEEHADELRSFGPEVVLDMIPMNEKDARGVVEVFGDVARRIVAISSEDVYRAYDVVCGLAPGPPDPTPLSEDAPFARGSTPTSERGSRTTRRSSSRG